MRIVIASGWARSTGFVTKCNYKFIRGDYCGQLGTTLLEHMNDLEYDYFGSTGAGALDRVGRLRGSVAVRLDTTASTAAWNSGYTGGRLNIKTVGIQYLVANLILIQLVKCHGVFSIPLPSSNFCVLLFVWELKETPDAELTTFIKGLPSLVS